MKFLKKKTPLFSSVLVLFLLTLLIIPTQQSCYFDNEEDLYPNTTCDTTDVKYSVEITKIMQDNCYSCHTGAGGVAGIAMETHSLLVPYATGGQLFNRINDTNSPMPPSGLMSDCDRQKIKAWIDAGAKND